MKKFEGSHTEDVEESGAQHKDRFKRNTRDKFIKQSGASLTRMKSWFLQLSGWLVRLRAHFPFVINSHLKKGMRL